MGENKKRRTSGNFEGKGDEERKYRKGSRRREKEKRGKMLKTRRT